LFNMFNIADWPPRINCRRDVACPLPSTIGSFPSHPQLGFA
jgi:hypothetical protein